MFETGEYSSVHIRSLKHEIRTENSPPSVFLRIHIATPTPRIQMNLHSFRLLIPPPDIKIGSKS